MKRIKFAISTLLVLLWIVGFSQETGVISGTVIDNENGETLIGATAQIVGSANATVTDIDGNFILSTLAPGKYEVQFSFVGYQIQKVVDVVVNHGAVTVLNVKLKSEATNLSEVVVSADLIRDSEAAILTMQKKAGRVLDGISSQQFLQ